MIDGIEHSREDANLDSCPEPFPLNDMPDSRFAGLDSKKQIILKVLPKEKTSHH
jgi:hypothetical protein